MSRPADACHGQRAALRFLALFNAEHELSPILQGLQGLHPAEEILEDGWLLRRGPLAVCALDTQLRFSRYSRNTVEIGQVVFAR